MSRPVLEPEPEPELSEAELGSALKEAVGGGVDLDSVAAAIAAKAEPEGLVEVAFAELPTPVGPLLAAATDDGLIQLDFPRADRDQTLGRLAAAVGPRVVEVPARFGSLERQLEEYFERRRRSFDLALDWRLTSGFTRRVLDVTAQIPYGETRSYADVAKAAGSPRAFRAAGSALGANPIPIVVPCHRVLRSGGGLGGYAGGLEVKQVLLGLESADG